MSQFTKFCAAAVKLRETEHLTLLHSVATGAQGSEKNIKDALKEIRENIDGD